AFGVPDAPYKRSGNQSTFESLLIGFNQQDLTLKRLGEIITAIETTAWNTASDPYVHTVEQNFRRLQDKYGRAYVPISCYGHFFNALYNGLLTNADTNQLHQSLGQAVENQACKNAPLLAERKKANRVAELTIEQLLTEIALNKAVVFVDTREPAEFAKSHIPGAINIPMRDLTPAVYDKLSQADRVISYCVKDFRGYEVARQMLDNGVSNVAVMKPHGLSGWQASGLPLASQEVSETTAQEQLTHCARDQQSCLN
ncbi:MAG: rhodanese-like domain-containing protein, partial [Pseudomonadota bacterium]